MFNKFLSFSITLVIISNIFTLAYANNYEYYDSGQSIENGDTYCIPKLSFKDKIKNIFIGQPTGFTPQIQPSPYLNPNYGPSYMQGYYSGNTWNSHNIYNPSEKIRLFGTSF